MDQEEQKAAVANEVEETKKEEEEEEEVVVAAVSKLTSQDDDQIVGDDSDDRLVLLGDVLKEVDEIEENELNAKAVLGGSDETNCSYAADPPRQALYACKTCEMAVADPGTGAKHQAGVCLACSIHCHEGHDLVELYTKRNFVCDCGTDKFAAEANFVCKLFDKRGLLNESNKYNHNFDGLYCTCNRPYPDEEDDVEDCMLQCGICEDWFHGRHLQKSGRPLTKPRFLEVLCQACVSRNDFLRLYMDGGAFEGVGSTDGETAAATTTEATEATEATDKKEVTASTSTASTSSTAFTSFKTVVEDLSHRHSSLATIQEEEEEEKKSSEQGGGDKGGVIGSSSSSSKDQKPKTEESGSCKLVKLKASFIANRSAWRDLKLAKEAEKKEEAEEKKENNSLRTPAEEEEKDYHQPMPFFFTGQWRHLLCTCPSCLALYDWQQIPFITSLEDQTCYYEANSLKRVEEREEAAFASLPHVAKVELMQNLQGFQARLGQFFNRFAGTSEVVTKRHVEEFFEGEYRRREARKRQRTDGVPPSECGSAGR
ncbi:putative E3 ubiquitin-protein ligase ubr7 [Tyrophagus putrescentiae]|nr:putative E3 ubiquitin-protein ligase ubr7 [Tyrophagus putrescentiae]